jgi:hypothetical protein
MANSTGKGGFFIELAGARRLDQQDVDLPAADARARRLRRCWCSRSFDRGNAEPLMSHDSAGRRRKCHLRIDQRPRLLHRKTLRIISRASETIRNFICFVPRASATIERCNGAGPRRDHVRCGVCVNCLRRSRDRDRRVGVVVDAAAVAVAP